MSNEANQVCAALALELKQLRRDAAKAKEEAEVALMRAQGLVSALRDNEQAEKAYSSAMDARMWDNCDAWFEKLLTSRAHLKDAIEQVEALKLGGKKSLTIDRAVEADLRSIDEERIRYLALLLKAEVFMHPLCPYHGEEWFEEEKAEFRDQLYAIKQRVDEEYWERVEMLRHVKGE